MSLSLDSKIYVAGHRGMVGSAIVRQLQEQGYTNILVRSRSELDLVNQQAVKPRGQTRLKIKPRGQTRLKILSISKN